MKRYLRLRASIPFNSMKDTARVLYPASARRTAVRKGGERGGTFCHAFGDRRKQLRVLSKKFVDLELHAPEVIEVRFHHANVESRQAPHCKCCRILPRQATC